MPGPWRSWKSLSCKTHKEEQVQVPVSISTAAVSTTRVLRSSNGCSKSLSSLKDVIHGNTKVVHKSASCSPQSKPEQDSKVWCSYSEHTANARLRHFEAPPQEQQQQLRSKSVRRFGGGCHGCNVADEAFGAIVLHKEYSRFLNPTCQRCGESFTKYEALEQHHAIRHAVTELGRGDSSKNIVEIIFRTSWLKKSEQQAGLTTRSNTVKIDRILKINNTQRTISKFEDYRDQVKARASSLQKKHPRCIADGNELLRFHGAYMDCSLGTNGSSSICSCVQCEICRIVRSGFSGKMKLIHTSATSGRAHDLHVKNSDAKWDSGGEDGIRAMLVCRVIAGRMHRGFGENVEVVPSGYDSVVAGDLDDLYVMSSRAVLPCFVVIYRCN